MTSCLSLDGLISKEFFFLIIDFQGVEKRLVKLKDKEEFLQGLITEQRNHNEDDENDKKIKTLFSVMLSLITRV